jgi:hypothetical protein
LQASAYLLLPYQSLISGYGEPLPGSKS